MKICYIFSNIDFITGQSGIALRLIENAQKSGYEIYIISNYNNQRDDFEPKGIKKLLIKGPSAFRTYLLNSHKIVKYLKEIKPDIIHVQGHLLIPFVYFLNKLVGLKIVCTLPERIDYYNKILKHLIIFSIKNIGLCFVLCQWIKDQLIQLGIPSDKILVAHIGLRDSFLIKQQEKPEDEYDIFYYGDASKERGFDVLCSLAKMLPHRKLKLAIRRVRDEKENLKELQKLKNVSVNHSCVEELKIRQLILRSRVVVLPYRWMGVQPPITLLEVMALGKCVLTGPLPGNRELIIDNENAVLINPNAPINEIIKKIETLLDNPTIIEKIGQKANKTILRYYSLSEYHKVFGAYEMIVNNFYEWRMFGNVGGDFVSRKEINTLLNLLQPEICDSILDVGTGSGRFARAIVKNSGSKIVGVDPDKKILKEGGQLRQIFLSEEESKRYKCLFGNGQNIKFDNNTFDKAFSFRALKYYPDPYKGISELYRVLRKGGILVLEITNNRSWESIASHFLPKSASGPRRHFWEKKNVSYFNPGRIKEYLLNKGMIIIDEKPLHKIPPLLYFRFKNQYINYLLDLFDKILLKITPKYLFSKSIVLKCRKL
jgi:glycosyltransferase involved in cell wall biosynthesis/2-polyprenyl-3-methyl-5-hydroxy-6-metoxy-1,4-benzoquinol methylase